MDTPFRTIKRPGVLQQILCAVAGLLLIFQAFFAISSGQNVEAAASDNDMIRGGVSTLNELRASYNSQADVRALYDRFGLTGDKLTNAVASNMTFNFAEQGAKGTRSVGRINFSYTNDHNLGKFAGTTFYSRNAAEWPGATPAYFFGKQKGADGKYYYIWVIKECGNLAYRPAEPPAPEPTPTPKPNPTPAPPSAPTPPETPAEVACVGLAASSTTGIRRVTTRFTGQYSANKPNLVTGIHFNFGDGTEITHNGTVTDHEYKNDTNKPVTYKAIMTVKSTLGDRTSKACAVTIQVLPELCPSNPDLPANSPQCGVCPEGQTGTYPDCEVVLKPDIPTPPSVVPAATQKAEPTPSLPSTGPTEIVTGAFGVGLLSYAGLQFALSRRRLFGLPPL